MARRLLLALIVLCELLVHADGRKPWWQRQDRRHWHQTMQDMMQQGRENFEKVQDGMKKIGKQFAEQIPKFEGADFFDGSGCDRKCGDKTQSLAAEVKKLERKLRRCSDERRECDHLARQFDATEHKLSACTAEVQDVTAKFEKQRRHIENMERKDNDAFAMQEKLYRELTELRSMTEQRMAQGSEDLSCPVAVCPEPICLEQARTSPALAAPGGLEGGRSRRWLPGAALLVVLLAAIAIRLWLRVRALADGVLRLEPALAAEQQKALRLEEELRAEFGGSQGDCEAAVAGEFSFAIEGERLGDVTTRRISVRCPGVAHDQIRIEGRPNGCMLTIQSPQSHSEAAGSRTPWTKLFQFRPSEGVFEFQKNLAELERGILTLVFATSTWVFTFPEHFGLAEGDREMAWMLSPSSELPLPTDHGPVLFGGERSGLALAEPEGEAVGENTGALPAEAAEGSPKGGFGPAPAGDAAGAAASGEQPAAPAEVSDLDAAMEEALAVSDDSIGDVGEVSEEAGSTSDGFEKL